MWHAVCDYNMRESVNEENEADEDSMAVLALLHDRRQVSLSEKEDFLAHLLSVEASELDEMYVGAKGSKDGPGRSTSRGTLRPRPPTREGTPVDLFAGVRARRSSATQAAEAVQTADALRGLSSGGESTVRV